MKKSKRQPPALQWPKLGDRLRYPVIEMDRCRRVPLRPLATALGCSLESLKTALSQLPARAACEAVYSRDDGRLARSPAVDEASLDYLLYAWRGKNGRSQVMQLRASARQLGLDALLALAPTSDQAKVQNEVLRFQLEVEKQKVSDRERQLDSAKAIRPGVALVNARWAAPASKEKFLEIWELRKQGLTEEAICSRVGLSAAVVRAFVRGLYTTVAAREAYADLQKRPEPLIFDQPTPTKKMPGNDP